MTETLRLRVGAPVHGGHALARHEGRVVFVRHAAPGELVEARLSDTGKIWRADAVEVLEPSPDRVPVAWSAAGPDGVGAVELAHLSQAGQLAWKHDVITDALRRIGDLDLPVTVSPAPADADGGPGAGWGSRTRIELAVDERGRAGMYAHRSHRIVPLDSMPLAVPAIEELGLFDRSWRPGGRLTAVAPSAAAPLVLLDGAPVRGARASVSERVVAGGHEHTYRVAGDGFWQVHRDAPAVLVEAVLGAVGDVAGATVLDLYSGAGLFTLPLAAAGAGAVHAVEGDERAAANARRNAHGLDTVHLAHGDVARALADGTVPDHADVVVLDPPRKGAGERVLRAVAEREPDRIVYVACDPAALARDLRTAAGLGYHADAVTAFDLFPHTHHVEAVAVLVRS